MRVGIVGLGRMGMPIATNLIEAGFTVTGHRRGNIDNFAYIGGIPVASNAEVAQRSDIVIVCVHEGVFPEIISGEAGLIHGAHPGLVIVDLSTVPVDEKEKQLHALQSVQTHLLDCPISGTPSMAAAKQAVLFASGEEVAYDICVPVFEAFATNYFYLGAFGAGMKMKYIANLLLAAHNVVAAEAMVMSTKAGLDPALVLQVISPSIASSTAFTSRALMMVEGRYLPAPGPIDTMYEVIELIRDFAKSTNCPTPMFSLAAQYYEQAIAEGRGKQDIASMYALLGKEAGLEVT